MPIKVTFLTFYYEAWDALAEIYAGMAADPRFEVSLAVISRRLTGDKDFDDASGAVAYFQALGLQPLVNPDLRELAPDYVVVNYPWQRNYPPQYRPDVLASFTRIVYVPYYSLPLVNEPADAGAVASHLYTQRMHQLASVIFTQDAFVQSAYAGTSRGNAHVHHVGSSKLDSLAQRTHELLEGARGDVADGVSADARPFAITWAPHHSYSPHWLNFGVFAQMHIAMLAWVRDHPDVVVTLRPHPFLFGTLVDRRVLTESELAEWRDAWHSLPNTRLDVDGDVAALFAATDLLVTDGISFLAEYPIATGKPAVFIEHQGHWHFSPIGELAANSAVRLNSFEEFVDGFEFIREVGLPDRSAEIEDLRLAANPYAGQVASRMIEIVAADSVSGPGGSLPVLVNSALITETAWELQPGREPLE